MVRESDNPINQRQSRNGRTHSKVLESNEVLFFFPVCSGELIEVMQIRQNLCIYVLVFDYVRQIGDNDRSSMTHSTGRPEHCLT